MNVFVQKNMIVWTEVSHELQEEFLKLKVF
jgi:hypothetical protein